MEKKKTTKSVIFILAGVLVVACVCTVFWVISGRQTNDDDSPANESIYVEKIDNLSPDFIGGMDVSSYVAEKDSGVKFYDFEGNELDDQGFFDLLKECGVDYVRIRVWNDPYDTQGRTYGGGNNDVGTAIQIGQWATRAGMRVMVDFHYSDFWADPNKQMVPKAWEDYTADQKAQAVGEFTLESLNELLDAGVDVGMVQIGNETTGWICGERDWENMCKIFQAGSAAVRSVAGERNHDMKVVLHFTNPERGFGSYTSRLAEYEVDYDVFACSYYPFWHGSLENLQKVLSVVAETYGKEVIVAETSWCYTYQDGDGSGNTISEGTFLPPEYGVNVQGQADAMRGVIEAVANATNGIGVFYWEPAWIPVQVYDPEARNAEKVLAQNREIWDQYGSGWATSYAGEYDPSDAGRYYGGSAVDNQALFTFDGHPLESLKIFDYVITGVGLPED